MAVGCIAYTPKPALTREDVVDNILSDAKDLPGSANQLRILNEIKSEKAEILEPEFLADISTESESGIVVNILKFTVPKGYIGAAYANAYFKTNSNGNREIWFSLGEKGHIHSRQATIAAIGLHQSVSVSQVLFTSGEWYVSIRQSSREKIGFVELAGKAIIFPKK